MIPGEDPGVALDTIGSEGRYLVASHRNAAAAYRRFFETSATDRVLETALHYELVCWVLGLVCILGFSFWLVL